MRVLIIAIFLISSTFSSASVIPLPRELKIYGKADVSVFAGKEYNEKVLQKISSIPEIKVREKENLFIQIKKPLNGPPSLKIDESYKLKVENDKVLVEASNEYGALHALETLRQLLTKYQGKLPPLEINDSPRFPWRGLLIDVVRHWMGPEELKKQIDYMARVKMNVLHLHLSDDQGFRLESKAFPKLHSKNNDGKYYTQDEMKEVIQYAGDRGVRVVPEFDVPGHATAMIAAYPELGSADGVKAPSREYGIHDNSLNPIKTYTYEFLEKLFSEMTALFPDEYFHVGGDEVTGKHWLKNEEIQAYMKTHNLKDIVELQFVFTKKIESLIKRLGKKMVAWDEVLKEGANLDAVAQIWRGPKHAKLALDREMPVLYSYGYYLDLQLSSETHYLMDPVLDMRLKKDPPLLLGGESAMWSERTDEDNVHGRIWPRNMAVAERLWSKASVRDVQDFYKRQSFLASSFNISKDLLRAKVKEKAKSFGISQESLSHLISWLEPGKYYSQHRYRKFTTDTPLNELVDYLPSESLKNTELNWHLNKWLKTKDKASKKKIKETFLEWKDLFEAAKEVKDPEFLLLVKDFKVLATMGEEALTYLDGKEKPSLLWVQENLTRLSMTGHLRHGVRPAMHATLEKLVNLVNTKYQ